MTRLLLALLATAALAAAEPPAIAEAPAGVGALPVLHEGRVKPFAIAAEESLLVVAGKTPFGAVVDDPAGRRIAAKAASPALVLALWRQAEAWRARPLVHLPWLALQGELGIPGQWASLDECRAADQRIAQVMEARRQAELTGEARGVSRDEQALVEFARRIDLAEELLAGRSLLLAPLAGDAAARAWLLETVAPLVQRHEQGHRRWRAQLAEALRAPAAERDAALSRADPWLTVEDLCLRPDPVLSGLAATNQAPAGVVELLAAGSLWWRAVHTGDGYPAAQARFEAALRDAAARREGELRARGVGTEQVAAYPAPGLIALELAYHRARPFTWAWLACLAGALALGWGARSGAGAAWRRIGTAASVLGLACIAAGLAARVAITGLGAVSNLYETLVWVAFIAGALGLALWPATGRIGYAVAGAATAALCALVGEAIPPEYGAAMGQLQPVLRSRFWLWLHVKVVVAAYAPFLLAWALGNWALWKAWRSGGRVGNGEALALYRCLQVGTVLMAAGTLLGGVWADQAWGRFWGWDPKEVGALIVVLVYLVPLHLRYVGWVGPNGMAAWSVLGFLSVLWSWYGVNFIQATGLHAYAFGSSSRLDQILVGGAVAAQIAFAGTMLAALRRRPAG